MGLSVGSRVGPYELTARLGAGGMGEVYRARDPQLGRDVAVKVLRSVSGDPDLRARFKREARVLAALSHPNIAVIHGFEQAGPEPALIMELVEGETLAERLSRATRPGSMPMPVSEAIELAGQLALALQSAHEKGIVHRDLKPANIKIRPDGTLKVLDFGIAKALAESSLEDVTVADTRAGVILGTPAYMSPEQTQGQAIDKRTDIWAFGCVLFEMLTLTRPFDAPTPADALAAVLTREPDWAALPESTPAPIRTLLRRCLQKDRQRRLADIADARFELADAQTMLSAPSSAPRAESAHRRGTRALVAGLVALVGLVLGAATTYLVVSREPVREPVRFEVSVPFGADSRIAISHDGRRLAYSAIGPAGTDLIWIRDLGRLDATPLLGTEGGYAPFWSPDGRSIGFFAGGSMKRISAAGGPVQTLVERLRPTTGSAAASWGADDRIIFGQVFGPLQIVPASGGTASAVTRLDEAHGEFGHYNPQFLPDGRHFLYDIGGSEQAGRYVGVLGSTERTRVINRRVYPAMATSNGFLLFIEDQRLKAQRFDLTRFAVTGESVTLAEGVTDFTASAGGEAVSYRSAGFPITRLTWFDRSGRNLGAIGSPGRFEVVALSPDDTRAAVSRDADIWVIDLARGTEVRLTSSSDWENFPVWSPDGSRIVYVSGVGQTMGGTLMQTLASGAGQTEVLFKASSLAYPIGWSRDGQFVTYFGSGRMNSMDLFVLPVASPRAAVPFLETPSQEDSNRLSPDGRFMSYSSDETGRAEIYVQTYPPSGQRWRISTDGGRHAHWRADGGELFFLGPDQTVMAVSIEDGARFQAGMPRSLFHIGANPRSSRSPFAPSRDGQRFLVNQMDEDVTAPIVVALDWSAQLGD